MTLQFRTEAFEVFNHPNFGNPNLNVQNSSFGKIPSTRFPTISAPRASCKLR